LHWKADQSLQLKVTRDTKKYKAKVRKQKKR